MRARTLGGASEATATARPGGWFGVVALIVSGLLTSLYLASGAYSREARAESLQKGRLVPALARSVESRRLSDGRERLAPNTAPNRLNLGP